MRNLTLNQVIEKIQLFTHKHLLIRSFAWGTASQLNSFTQNNDELPLLYAEINNISLLQNTVEYSFRFTVIDSRTRTVDNLQDVMSDTAQILTDLRKYLIYGAEMDYWSLENDVAVLLPLVNSSNDWLSGFTMNLEITTGLIQSDCDVPFEED
jgi:hypothetical protein